MFLKQDRESMTQRNRKGSSKWRGPTNPEHMGSPLPSLGGHGYYSTKLPPPQAAIHFLKY